MRKEIIKEENEKILNDFLFSEVWNPAADIYETKEEIIILIELAGVKQKDVQLSINKNNVLHIWGKRKNPFPARLWERLPSLDNRDLEVPPTDKIELHFGTFSKYLQLPVKVKKRNAEIKNINGIFKIALEKLVIS